MDTKYNRLKFEALEKAVYCPEFKEKDEQTKPIEEIKLGEFDVEKAKDQVRSSVNLLSYEKSHRPIIIEILDVLERNKNEFLMDKQKYITFYWNGILVMRITIDHHVDHNRQLHVSLAKYSDVKKNLISDKKNMFMFKLGMISLGLLGGVVAIFSFFRSRN